MEILQNRVIEKLSNRQLQELLKEAYLVIKAQKQQIRDLKQQLSQYENAQQNNEQQQSTFYLRSDEEEVFTSKDSDEDEDHDLEDFQEDPDLEEAVGNDEEEGGLGVINTGGYMLIDADQDVEQKFIRPVEMEEDWLRPISISGKIEKTPPTKVIFNYLSEGSHVPRLLAKQSKKQSKPVQQVPTKQKWQNTQHSAIKTQQPIQSKNFTSTIFNRIKSSQKIFDTFFITGYSFQSQTPTIDYIYPTPSKHIPAILSLIYTQNSLRPVQSQFCMPNTNTNTNPSTSTSTSTSPITNPNTFNFSSMMSRSPRNANTGAGIGGGSNLGLGNGRLSVKDSFVMILCKNQNGEKEYLFACEVQDVLEGGDRMLYHFNRLFCFISSCSLFSAFLKIVQQFLNKINQQHPPPPPPPHYQPPPLLLLLHLLLLLLPPISMLKSLSLPVSPAPAKNKSTHPQQPQIQLQQILEQNLNFLFEKTIQENQSLSLRLDKNINIFIDVPSSLESYRNLLEYRPWGILFCPVYLSYEHQIKEKQLFGFLLVYMLTETKIMLYSMSKSKVSQAILHALEMIKPLEYVNPIIMATIKDEYQEYFNAPMSVVMGLWGEQKLKRKQKIEIFMNKKANFCSISGILQQNKMGNIDGVVFNLDTGYTFGGGLCPSKNKLAIQLNSLLLSCKKTKQQYKIIQQLLLQGQNKRIYQQTQKLSISSSSSLSLSDRFIEAISGTQLYSVFMDKCQRMLLQF